MAFEVVEELALGDEDGINHLLDLQVADLGLG
jgi:hypothetical protein